MRPIFSGSPIGNSALAPVGLGGGGGSQQKRICLLAIFRDFFLPTVVSQFYVTEAENEYVIRGNAAVMKCKIPSFVADFVFVEAWIGEDGTTHMYNNGYDSYGKCAREL